VRWCARAMCDSVGITGNPVSSTAAKSAGSCSAWPVNGEPSASLRPIDSSRLARSICSQLHADATQHQRGAVAHPALLGAVRVHQPVEVGVGLGPRVDGPVDLAEQVALRPARGVGADGLAETLLRPLLLGHPAHPGGEHAGGVRDDERVVRTHLQQQVTAVPALLELVDLRERRELAQPRGPAVRHP